jgi:hypothetical protein
MVGPLQLGNILITEKQEVKFIDSCVIDPTIVVKLGVYEKRCNNKYEIYEQLSSFLFDLLIP